MTGQPNLDVLLNKAQTIERSVQRAREEYLDNPATFATDYRRQDAAVLNMQRACEASLDLAQHLLASLSLGIAQSARDGFALLARAGIIGPDLSNSLQAMVGFRNIAVHDYQQLNMGIVEHIIQVQLDDLLQFSSIVLKQFSSSFPTKEQ